MANTQKTHSHPVCSTCQSDLTGRETLKRIAGEGDSPTANDDMYNFYEETVSLLRFLSALVQAGPPAGAYYMDELKTPPDWLSDFSRLSEELTEETERRLDLLRTVGRIWQKRAESAGKES
jgi:hypothetical protein